MYGYMTSILGRADNTHDNLPDDSHAPYQVTGEDIIRYDLDTDKRKYDPASYTYSNYIFLKMTQMKYIYDGNA